MTKEDRIKINEEVKLYPHFPGVCVFINDHKRTRITVVNEDCLVAAKRLQNPLVLVMASQTKPGGGVLSGARAQEEDVFRRTNLINIIPAIEPEYPLTTDNKGIYCFDVDVLRDTEENNYAVIDPYKISAFIIPALNFHSNDRFIDKYWDKMTERIVTIFEAAKLYGHRNLVLGAFGCGVFGNDPWKVSMIFKDVIHGYSNYFDNIVFACMCAEGEDINYQIFKNNLERKK